MVKYIEIDGKNIPFKATASTLARYSSEFNDDALELLFDAREELKNTGGFSTGSLCAMFNLAYVMARQADPSISADPFDWLDSFDVFDLNEVMPKIMALWAESMGTVIESKKN